MNISSLLLASIFALLALSHMLVVATSHPILSETDKDASATGHLINLGSLRSQFGPQVGDGHSRLNWNEGRLENTAMRQQRRLTNSASEDIGMDREGPTLGTPIPPPRSAVAPSGRTLGTVNVETNQFLNECRSCCERSSNKNRCKSCSVSTIALQRSPGCRAGSALGRSGTPSSCFFVHCSNAVSRHPTRSGCTCRR